MIAIVGLMFVVVGGIWYFGRQPAETTNLTAVPTTALEPTGVETETIMAKPTMTDITELKIEDLTIGDGEEVETGDTVVMHYTGTLVDGTKFDSSLDRGQPFTTQIGVGRVIEGWDKGVPGMKVGGKRMLYIPSEMGYGARGAGSAIPPNADLIFEVELLDVQKPN